MNGDHQNYSISSNDPGHFFLISDDDSSSSSNSSCTIFPSSSNKRESISSADENSPRLVFVPPSPDESDSSTDSLDSGVIQEGTFDPSRIGQGYQAVIPDLKTKPHKVPVQDEKRAGTQVWSSRQISNRKSAALIIIMSTNIIIFTIVFFFLYFSVSFFLPVQLSFLVFS
eukprot:gb/GECH01010704.1/.p1 GENE.gb/GECH01010704.1/~~gb/GECH01010704.1/.p1  ORF type:complete len:170 (+),score=23.81 gb/GECH01010704.1/:1-510(+)